MENRTHRNIFESTFDSFDLDSAFILNKDDDLMKPKINIKEKNPEKKFSHEAVHESEMLCNGNKINGKMKQFDDLSLLLEDLDESDFFERSISKNKKKSLQVTSSSPNNESRQSNGDTCCLSPILLSKPRNKVSRSFSSTPLKPNCSSDPVENKKGEELEEKKPEGSENNSEKISELELLEAGLFDDWDAETNSQKDSITLSQALKLIEAESAKQSMQKKDLNTSIDLLTGRPVGDDVEDLFAESFNLPNLIESKQESDSSDDCFIKSEESDSGSRLLAFPRRLNVKTKTVERKNNSEIDFNSDDDFDFLTQELLKKPKCVKTLTELKGFSSDDSSGCVMKRGKSCRIIDSDSADETPDSEFNKRCSKRKVRKPKHCKRSLTNEFIESEAEVSDTVKVSSDESEEEGEYDASFVDEELYLTQNYSANMTTEYLKSVKNPSRPNGFKIPPAKAYIPDYVFSQIPEDNNSEYELDSFCVNEVEEETKTDLSDLEIAEKILEMDRKKKKRKRILQGSVKN